MTQEQHFDVASYALGVLDARDAAHPEDEATPRPPRGPLRSEL